MKRVTCMSTAQCMHGDVSYLEDPHLLLAAGGFLVGHDALQQQLHLCHALLLIAAAHNITPLSSESQESVLATHNPMLVTAGTPMS